MPRYFKISTLCLVLVTAHWSGLQAAQTKPAPPAPVPVQIVAAKRVFIANAGGDELAPDGPSFSGEPSRAYDQFYAAMKGWGRFEIVDSPAQADLLLEIRQEVRAEHIPDGPLFQLTIRDPRTNALLWAFHIHGQFAMGQSNSDRNFDQTVARLVSHLQALVVQPPAGDATKP
jgi:hypothetical protein